MQITWIWKTCWFKVTSLQRFRLCKVYDHLMCWVMHALLFIHMMLHTWPTFLPTICVESVGSREYWLWDILVARKRNKFLLSIVFYCFENSSIAHNLGTTGPIQVGFSGKCTSPNENFNQILKLKMSHARVPTDLCFIVDPYNRMRPTFLWHSSLTFGVQCNLIPIVRCIKLLYWFIWTLTYDMSLKTWLPYYIQYESCSL